jgi:regulator of RNase E activity RraA
MRVQQEPRPGLLAFEFSRTTVELTRRRHRGPYKGGPGEINVPISFDGKVIEPGDLLIGDDGVLCVRFDRTDDMYRQARAKNEAESKTVANTNAGKLDPKLWVDETPRRVGCEGA